MPGAGWCVSFMAASFTVSFTAYIVPRQWMEHHLKFQPIKVQVQKPLLRKMLIYPLFLLEIPFTGLNMTQRSTSVLVVIIVGALQKDVQEMTLMGWGEMALR